MQSIGGVATALDAARQAAAHDAVSADATDPYDDVANELRRVIKLGRTLTHRQMKAYDGIAPALFGVLAMVERLGPMRTTEIAEAMYVDVSVASRQVGELEQHALIERHRDPVDARACLVAVTAAGAAAVATIRERQRAVARSVLRDWTTEELQTFVAGLRRFGDDISRGAFNDAVPHL